jgi:hypothetical protein
VRRGVTLRAALLAPLVLTSTALADGDILQLKDGRFVDGVPLKLDDKSVVAAYKSAEVRIALDLVEDYVIDGVTPDAATDDDKAQRANGMVRWRGRWMRPEARDKAMKKDIEDRRKEIAEAKAHSEWRNRYRFESKNFRFESTLSEAQNQYFSALFDAYYEFFKKDWNIAVPKDWGKLKVCIYPTMEDFLRGTGVPRGVLAYYMFAPNPERELNFFNSRSDLRMTETTMFHECNHYLVDLFGQGFQYPHWVGESMAEYYGAATYDPKTKVVKVGLIQEGRLAEVRSDIEEGKRFSLLKMITENGGSHYEDYYWGWSFTHFMMETPAYQKLYRKFFVDLARAPDVKRGHASIGAFQMTTIDPEECLRVFRKRMGINDGNAFTKLENEWYAYVDKLQAPGVRGYEEAGEKAFWDGQTKFRAPRLLRKAIEMGSRKPDVYIALSRCMRRSPEGCPEALEVMKKACDIDPLNADVWAERGFVLQLMGNKDEGKKLVDLAYELNPGGYFADFQTLLLTADGK